jgi:chemotaxis signal transduction protein
VIDVDHDRFEAPPGTLSATWRAVVDGVYQQHPDLVLVLDVEATTRLESPTS